jgi:uncharacterized protein YdiU (UPF0061 family)
MFEFDNSYARLPDRLYARLAPTPVAAPELVRLNRPLAGELGLDADQLATADGVAVLAGNRLPDGAQPLAQAYAGHQFGNFVPQLGDGRAILLGELIDSAGRRRDLQLKGSGPTPFSRRGDGRAVLGPVLREYLISEAMHALGIPTTRALAAVTTGETVYRDRPLPGAILTRVAASHLRVGTFEFFAVRRDVDALRTLVDVAIDRHYPDAAGADNRALALLDRVMARQAELVARWLGVGFIHGVMNTDNTAISGETIDYGPCAFMDRFDPATVFSSIDRGGRYAYGAQPQIIGWNMARLAEALLPVVDDDPAAAVAAAQARIEGFPARMDDAWLAVMRRKLGLATARDGDRELVLELLHVFKAGEADFTNGFRALCAAAADPAADGLVEGELADPARYRDWAGRWRARLAGEDRAPAARRAAMERANPAFIPRNHRVEAALDAAVDGGDLAPFDELLAVLSRPYDDQPERADYRQPPAPSERVYQTFCGT